MNPSAVSTGLLEERRRLIMRVGLIARKYMLTTWRLQNVGTTPVDRR